MTRFRKHLRQIATSFWWKLILCVLAIIGAVTTVQSFWSDVLKPLVMSERRTTIELVDLMATFSPAPGEGSIEWTTASEMSSPITWTSNDRDGEIPESDFFRSFSCARTGVTQVLIDGTPSHFQFDQTLHPANWSVTLYGPMASSTCVQITTDGSSSQNLPELTTYLSRYAKLVEKHPQTGHTFIGNLYRLDLPRREPVWFIESWSIGNHSWFVELTMFPKEDFELAQQYLHQLLGNDAPEDSTSNDEANGTMPEPQTLIPNHQ